MSVNPVERAVLDVIAERWSPYRFRPQEVEDEKILQCLEAARWAASCFNDQPWSWIIARRQDNDSFERMLGCLVEGNRAWASQAGVLLLCVMQSRFAYNGKPNRVALYDLGQSAAHIALQATALGLHAHQMAGVNLSVARHEYGIGDGYEPQTAIAIGYADDSPPVNDVARKLSDRESGPRGRKPLADSVFEGKWGTPADFVS